MSEEHPYKVVCEECGWQGQWQETLLAEHPFQPGFDIHGCPGCKEAECFYQACDEPNCWQRISCGTPTPKGYRNTCHSHQPKERL